MINKLLLNTLILAFSLLFTCYSLANTRPLSEEDWEDDDWAEQEVSPWLISGFVEAGYGQFLQENIVESNASLTEITARINLDYSHESFELATKTELTYDDIKNDTLWKTRELNISFSPSQNSDVKLGRQILTWGTGDYIFLNDLFAKNWQSFFAGR